MDAIALSVLSESHIGYLRTERDTMTFEVDAEPGEVWSRAVVHDVSGVAKEGEIRHCTVPPLIGESTLLEGAGGAFGDLANTGLSTTIRLRNVW